MASQYLLMIDADTVVDPLALNYLVGSFVEDKKGARLHPFANRISLTFSCLQLLDSVARPR